MTEHEPRPATPSGSPDLRRLEVATTRFHTSIAESIDAARKNASEIDDATARCIAHVLGRAYGPDSHLAAFGREGVGDYLELREEYLPLYNDYRVDGIIKDYINWFGTYLIRRENTADSLIQANEQLLPDLHRLLVTTRLTIGKDEFTVHIPASCDSREIKELHSTLIELRLPEDDALQAFLELPDVNAMTGDIMASFEDVFIGRWDTVEQAIRQLVQLDTFESDLRIMTTAYGFPDDAITIDNAAIEFGVRQVYDITEKGGHAYVFAR